VLPPSAPLRFRSVRGRLLLLIAALAVPTLAILSWLSWESYHAQRDAVRAELGNTARAVASVVDAELDRSLAMLQTLAATHAMQQRDWARLDETARRILPDSNRWLVIVDLQGRPLVNTRLPPGATAPHIPLDPAYVRAMRAGEVYISNIVFGPAAQQLVVHIGLPCAFPDGELYGLNLVMTPDALGETLRVRRFAPDSVLTIADRTGRIITRNPYQKDFIGRPATPDMVRAIQSRFEGERESVTLEGIPVFTIVTHAKGGWGVLLGMPKARVFANTQRLFYIALGSALLAAAAATALAAWIARAVVRSVDDLAREAARLARGETSAPVKSDLQEFSVVAEAMRGMAATRTEAELQLREARDRLHGYAQELERRVDERTASLREAVAQMEEFSYTVSHDLRGPLRTISGYAEVLLEDYAAAFDEQGRDYLQRILRAADRMNRLTSGILDYTRVAQADLPRARVALEPLLRATLEQYPELQSAAADVTLVTPLHDVMAHEPSITQALANLLTNAAKFVKPGRRPRITVRTEPRGARVRLWIEDEGIGIPPEQQAKLFQIFERAPGAKGYQGTGVGLAIVRKIVEKSGGTCGVESDGTSGSRFWIELQAAHGV
jgi:signal transduction histidine kinase